MVWDRRKADLHTLARLASVSPDDVFMLQMHALEYIYDKCCPLFIQQAFR